jgi:hypothetical protein
VLLCLGTQRVQDRCVDGAGAEDVHANSPLLQFHQPSAREGTHRGFAGAVDAKRWEALDTGNGTIQKDGTVVIEKRQRLLHGKKSASHIQIKDLVEVIFRHLFQSGQFALAGAGKEDVNSASFALHGLIEAIQVGQVRGVALYACDVLADQLDGLVQFLLATSRDENVPCQRWPR